MKRFFASILAFILAFLFVSAVAESWVCQNCGKTSEGNFCAWCGTPKPEDKLVCPGCGVEVDLSAGYSFCSNCGASLLDIRKEHNEISIGLTYRFGHYEQDNNPNNGPESITWIVLDIQNGKALMLSEFGLAAKQFSDKTGNVIWESSSLRSWLNNDFFNEAFSREEKLAICKTIVNNADDQGPYYQRGGILTKDHVFLLSYHEAYNMYFSNNEDRMCVPTEYAIANGAATSSNELRGRATGYWWLRSPGYLYNETEFVNGDGSPFSAGSMREYILVRPAVWVDLDKVSLK